MSISSVDQDSAVSRSTIDDARTPKTVVVGLDGSSEALHALEWAKAALPEPKSIIAVSAYDLPNPFIEPALGSLPVNLSIFEEAAQRRMSKDLADQPEDLQTASRVEMGHPGTVLCRVARNADLLVVGTRGRGGLVSTLLGSTSSFCVKHSPAPVAVVPADAEVGKPIQSVTVGVDGSANADAALRWAVDSVASGGTVHALTAISNSSYADSGYAPTVAGVQHQLRQVVRDAVSRIRAGLNDRISERHLTVEVHVRQQDARVALSRVAQETDSDVIVIGARGSGGLEYLVLGSVATAMVHHPTTVTVVIGNPDTSV